MLSADTTFDNQSLNNHVLDPDLTDPADLYNAGDNIDVLMEIASDCDLDVADEVASLSKEAYQFFPRATDQEIIALIKESLIVLEEVKKLKEKLELGNTKQHHKIITGIISDPLNILERQYNMALDILLCQREKMGNWDTIREKYADLGIKAIVIGEKQEICFNAFTHCLNLNSKVLIKDLRKVVERLLVKPTSRRALGELQIIMSKLETVSECLPFAATCDPNDLFAISQSDPYWEQLKQHVNIETLGPSNDVRKSYKRFMKQLSTGVSMFSRGVNYKEGLAKTIVMGLGGIYDFFASEQAQRRATLFYSKPDQKTAFQIWNLLDEKSVLQVMKVSFTGVEHSKRIYIPRQFDSLTFETVMNAYHNNTLNTVDKMKLHPVDLEAVFQGFNSTLLTYKQLRTPKPDNIPLRIISAKALPITKLGFLRDNLSKSTGNMNEGSETRNESYMGKMKRLVTSITHLGEEKIPRAAIDPYFDGVILHIHGGGFVAMSSGSHQAYTRQWAQMVQKPVLSLDYRLAPKHPYPAGLDDCWQVYNWILFNMEHTIGIHPSKIILVGDSAGGNLVLGVTFLAIKIGLRVPDGLLLAYPALNLEANTYSPSLLLSLDDQIIPHSVLKMIAQVYIPPGGKPNKDPFLSPSHASRQLLEKLPPIRIMVGDRDPFHDECWRFTDKLRKLDKDVAMTVYKDMPHGFLGFDMPGGMSEARKCVKDGARMLSELLSK